MQIKMLGSGCWEGTPAPFCQCRICRIASQDHNSIEYRSRPEILVENEGKQFLIEISPDIRTQSTRFELPAITDFIVSHWHFDHMFGLYELHAWIELVVKSPVTIYCSEAAAGMLDRQFGFIPTNIKTIRAFQPFYIHGVKITPVPLYHMYATDEAKSAADLDNTFGYILEYQDKSVAYLADYYRAPAETIDLVKRVGTVIADGTYLFQDSYPNKPYQNETIDEKDSDHLHGTDIIKFTSSLDVEKVIYHSITHLPEKTHSELQAMLPDRHFIGFDGMKVE